MGTQEQEEVRTLFVSGLPNDTKPREVYLLFRTYEGYQGSFLKLISSKLGKPPQPIAFVSFGTRKQAEFALLELHGIRFDPGSPQTLRLEFARSNSRLHPNQSFQGALPASSAPLNTAPNCHQPPISYPVQPNVNGVYGVYVMPNVALTRFAQQQDIAPPPNPRLYDIWSDTLQIPVPFQGASRLSTPSPTFEFSPTSAHLSVLNILSDSDSSYIYNPQEYHCGYPTMYSMYPQIYYEVMTPSSPSSAMDTGPNVDILGSGNVPSSTLIVSNLEPYYTEERVKLLFASCEGFVKVTVFSKGDPPFAFVDFKNAACASQAMERFQGHVLPSSTGIKIEFVKQCSRESPTSSDSNASSPTTSRNTKLSNGSPKSIPVKINSDSSRPSQQYNAVPLSSVGMMSTIPSAPNDCTPNGMYRYNAPFSFVHPGGYKPPQIFMNNFSSSSCMSTN